MIAKMPHLITTGDYIKLRGHKVNDHLYLAWHKVTSTEDGTLLLVDRNGKTSRVNIKTAGHLRWKCLVWERGDDRADEHPDVLNV